MIEGGEDPLFIARRMVIFASEDISLADVHALPLATAAFQACQTIGLPECRIHLAHVAIYLARCPKSNETYAALNAAQDEVRNSKNLPVPLHLRPAATELLRELGYQRDYRYTHDHPDEAQQFLPDELTQTTFYTPKSKHPPTS
jgi:putative ATPase